MEGSAERFVRVREAAHRLDLCEQTVRGLASRGDLPSVRVGRSLRIPESAITDLLELAQRAGRAAEEPRTV